MNSTQETETAIQGNLQAAAANGKIVYRLRHNGQRWIKEPYADTAISSVVSDGQFIYYRGRNRSSLVKRSIENKDDFSILATNCYGTPAVDSTTKQIFYRGGESETSNELWVCQNNKENPNPIRLNTNCGQNPVTGGEYVFYLGANTNELFRMKQNGTGNKQIDTVVYSPPFVLGSDLYLQGGPPAAPGTLWMRNKLGDGPAKKFDKAGPCHYAPAVVSKGDLIFYMSEDKKLSSYNVKESEKRTSPYTGQMQCALQYGWVYFVNSLRHLERVQENLASKEEVHNDLISHPPTAFGDSIWIVSR